MFRADLSCKIIALLAASPIVVSFFLLINQYAINFPFWDDFDSVFEFLHRFREAGLIDRFLMFFEQHNEHRMVLNRVAVVLNSALMGSVDLRALMFAAGFGLVLLFFCIVLCIDLSDRILTVLIVLISSLIIFQPLYSDGMVWVTTSLQSFWVTGFASAVFLLLQRPSLFRFSIAALISFVAAFTQGNGILVPLIGVLQLLILKERRAALYWLLVVVSILALFLLGYRSEHSLSEALFKDPLRSFHFVVAFLGHGFSPAKILEATWFGAVTLSLWMLAVFCGAAFRAPAIFSLSLFAAGSAAIVTLTRYDSEVDVWVFGLGRYMLVANLFATSVVILLAHSRLPMSFLKGAAALGVGTAVCFSISAYRQGIDHIQGHVERISREAIGWVEGQDSLSYPDGPRASRLMDQAIRSGDFVPTGPVVGTLFPIQRGFVPIHQEVRGYVDNIAVNTERGFVSFRGWGCFSFSCQDFPLVLRLEPMRGRVIGIAAQRVRRPEIAHAIGFREFEAAGFSAVVPLTLLKPGSYTVRMVIPTQSALVAYKDTFQFEVPVR